MATVSTTNVRDFAQALVCDGGSDATLGNFALELFRDELPQIPNGWTAQTTLIDLVADTATIDVSQTQRKVYAVFHGGRELSRESLAALEAIGSDWHNRRGSPRCWTEVREEDGTFRVYPKPVLASMSGGSISTEVDRVVILAFGINNTIPKYLRLPAALWILSRDYARESPYRDTDFSKIAKALAERFFEMVDGVAAPPQGQPE